jgi:opacity protein-like surface antigen
MKAIHLTTALLVGCTTLSATAAYAQEGGMFVGIFGGIGSTASQSIEQTGTAHKEFAGDREFEGRYYLYDLPVRLDGRNVREMSTLVGGHLGYGWAVSSALKPAFEVEGLYLTAGQEAALVNAADEVITNITVIQDGAKQLVTRPNERHMVEHHGGLAAGSHTFLNTSTMQVALFTLNGVVSYSKGGRWTPYVGAGVGMAVVHLDGAVAIQTGPGGVESSGAAGQVVNHFNSRDEASDVALAAQAKAGVRYRLSARTALFVDYRYVHLAPTVYTFGSTIYPDHAPTDAWIVRNGSMRLHHALAGLHVSF